jgi:hypothetical protein
MVFIVVGRDKAVKTVVERFAPEGEGLAALRRSLQVRPASEKDQQHRWLTTGFPEIDTILDGGFLRGRLSEVIGPRSSGRTALLLATVAAATARGEVVSWIDPASALDARAVMHAGVSLPRLLWIRPRRTVDALVAADWVLSAGGFTLCVIDFGEHGRSRLPDGAWARLSRAAERADAAVVVLAEDHLSGTFAAVTLALAPLCHVWAGLSPKHSVLSGRLTKACVVRSKVGVPERTAVIHFGEIV